MGLLDPLSNHSNILVCDAVLAALDEHDVRQRYLGWGREGRAPHLWESIVRHPDEARTHAQWPFLRDRSGRL
jgi:hypothetical protein